MATPKKTKARQKRSKASQLQKPKTSPFSAGPGGSSFEIWVSVTYLVDLLLGALPPGLLQRPLEVRLQQSFSGAEVDDIIVVAGAGGTPQLAIQAKHAVVVSARNKQWSAGIRQCWAHSSSYGFDPSKVTVAVGCSNDGISAASKARLRELAEWAQTAPSFKSFFSRVKQFAWSKSLFVTIQKSVSHAAGRPVKKEDLWSFLTTFQLLTFDLRVPASDGRRQIVDRLRVLTANGNPAEAQQLADRIYRIATDTAKAGGTITASSLAAQLPITAQARLTDSVKTGARSVTERVQEHSLKQIAALTRSRKYIADLYVDFSVRRQVLRTFIDPLRFFPRILREGTQICVDLANHYLSKLGLAQLSPPHLQSRSDPVVDLRDLPGEIVAAVDEWTKWRERVRASSPNRSGMLDDQGPNPAFPQDREELWALDSVTWGLHRLAGDTLLELQTAAGGLLIIRSEAGSGKTSFACDVVRHYLSQRRLVLFLTGKELSSLGVETLEAYILRQAVGDVLSRPEQWDALQKECTSRKSPFVILIDAINEHENLADFSLHLEFQLTELLKHDFVRVILTCRREFYQYRFARLETAVFAPRIRFIDDLAASFTADERRLIVDRHLNHFKIDVDLRHSARTRLEDSPLLLRIYCEAFSRPDGRVARLPPQANIYRSELFQHFFKTKFDALAERRRAKGRSPLTTRVTYWPILHAVSKAMYASGRFDLVPLPALQLSDAEWQLLEDLIEEEAIVSKTVSWNDGRGVEAIAFPYDELRDYVLAEFVAAVADSSQQIALVKRSQAIRDSLSPNATTSEGVGRYLYCRARTSGNAALLEVVRNSDGSDSIRLRSLFELPDHLITDDDIAFLKERFAGGDRAVRWYVFVSLLNRTDDDLTPQLGCHLAADWLGEMTETELSSKIFPMMDSSSDRYTFERTAIAPIEDVAEALASSLTSASDAALERSPGRADVLVFLRECPGRYYGTPAKDVLVEQCRKRPVLVKALADRLMRKGKWSTLAVLRLVEDLVASEVIVPTSVLHAAAELRYSSDEDYAHALARIVSAARYARVQLPVELATSTDHGADPAG